VISAFVNTVVSAFRTANTSVLYRKNPRIAGRENQPPLGKSDLVYSFRGSLIGITFYCNPHKIIGLEKKEKALHSLSIPLVGLEPTFPHYTLGID
jgi:hypothetical protein